MRLHNRLDGPEAARVVVLGSSLGTTLDMWEPQVAALAATHRVLRYDRRGHGGSPVRPGPATIDDLGGDLLALLDALGLERVSLCGLSLGGVEAMWLAANAPERVDRLVLACTKAAFLPREAWVERAATVRDEGITAVAGAALGRWFTPAAPTEVVERFRSMLHATPAEGYAACCDALADADLRPRLGEIAAPTLVLTAREDPSVTPADGDELAAAIPDARHVVLDGAAHIANAERPDAFTAALLRHLDEEGA
jgi:3-oxoadipate enol-lactonase